MVVCLFHEIQGRILNIYTLPSSTKFVTMTILFELSCHAILHMSFNVFLLGPNKTYKCYWINSILHQKHVGS